MGFARLRVVEPAPVEAAIDWAGGGPGWIEQRAIHAHNSVEIRGSIDENTHGRWLFDFKGADRKRADFA